MNILITTSSFSAGIPTGLNVLYNPCKRKLSEDETIELISRHRPVGIIAGVEPLTRRVLECADSLRVISRCGTGVDSIDLDAAAERGIIVTTTPEAPVESVAELTVGLILSLIRKINLNDAALRKGIWKGLQGNLLHGKTAGIIGCGRIGGRVGELLSAFGCKICGNDPAVREREPFRMIPFDELLKISDVVTLHIPYTVNNRCLIDADRIGSMKKTALLVNASRGGIIDEDALYAALKSGAIAGAALDCFEDEPYSGRLIELNNIVLSPHMGSNTAEGRVVMDREAVGNLIRELRKLNLF